MDNTKNIIIKSEIRTQVGLMYICSTEKGICMFDFAYRKSIVSEFNELKRLLNAEIVHGINDHVELLKMELDAYFNGKLINFSVPLHTPGTDFQQKVWNELLRIPYGETRSYKQQAIALGSPESVRAVANANGKNRIAIVIPCHRVIGDNGELTGYGGGLEKKRWLLEHESKNLRLF